MFFLSPFFSFLSPFFSDDDFPPSPNQEPQAPAATPNLSGRAPSSSATAGPAANQQERVTRATQSLSQPLSNTPQSHMVAGGGASSGIPATPRLLCSFKIIDNLEGRTKGLRNQRANFADRPKPTDTAEEIFNLEATILQVAKGILTSNLRTLDKTRVVSERATSTEKTISYDFYEIAISDPNKFRDKLAEEGAYPPGQLRPFTALVKQLLGRRDRSATDYKKDISMLATLPNNLLVELLKQGVLPKERIQYIFERKLMEDTANCCEWIDLDFLVRNEIPNEDPDYMASIIFFTIKEALPKHFLQLFDKGELTDAAMALVPPATLTPGALSLQQKRIESISPKTFDRVLDILSSGSNSSYDNASIDIIKKLIPKIRPQEDSIDWEARVDRLLHICNDEEMQEKLIHRMVMSLGTEGLDKATFMRILPKMQRILLKKYNTILPLMLNHFERANFDKSNLMEYIKSQPELKPLAIQLEVITLIQSPSIEQFKINMYNLIQNPAYNKENVTTIFTEVVRLAPLPYVQLMLADDFVNDASGHLNVPLWMALSGIYISPTIAEILSFRSPTLIKKYLEKSLIVGKDGPNNTKIFLHPHIRNHENYPEWLASGIDYQLSRGCTEPSGLFWEWAKSLNPEEAKRFISALLQHSPLGEVFGAHGPFDLLFPNGISAPVNAGAGEGAAAVAPEAMLAREVEAFLNVFSKYGIDSLNLVNPFISFLVSTSRKANLDLSTSKRSSLFSILKKLDCLKFKEEQNKDNQLTDEITSIINKRLRLYAPPSEESSSSQEEESHPNPVVHEFYKDIGAIFKNQIAGSLDPYAKTKYFLAQSHCLDALAEVPVARLTEAVTNSRNNGKSLLLNCIEAILNQKKPNNARFLLMDQLCEQLKTNQTSFLQQSNPNYSLIQLMLSTIFSEDLEDANLSLQDFGSTAELHDEKAMAVITACLIKLNDCKAITRKDKAFLLNYCLKSSHAGKSLPFKEKLLNLSLLSEAVVNNDPADISLPNFSLQAGQTPYETFSALNEKALTKLFSKAAEGLDESDKLTPEEVQTLANQMSPFDKETAAKFLSKLIPLNREERNEAFKPFFSSLKEIANGEFKEKRYEESKHYIAIREKAEGVGLLDPVNQWKTENWKSHFSLNRQTYTIGMSDNFFDFLRMSQGIAGCQSIDHGSARDVKTLLGNALDGKIRLLCVKDSEGRIVGRAVLKLLWHDEEEKPVLCVENVRTIFSHDSAENTQLNAKLREQILNIGGALGFQVLKNNYSNTVTGHFRSLAPNRAGTELADLLGKDRSTQAENSAYCAHFLTAF